MKRKPKILLVQTANQNLGDQVLADNNAYLLEKALSPEPCDILRCSISSRDIGQVRYADAVVFAGGILKVTNELFWQYIPELIREADKYNVPVFLSAVGCEAFFPGNAQSEELKAALNLPAVRGISCRDDIETLRRDYMENPAIRLFPVTDPAVWCRDTYHEVLSSPAPAREQEGSRGGKKGIIGLGIVREKLFADYGHPEIGKEDQLRFWFGVIGLLEDEGYEWCLFTNGDAYDEQMAGEVLRAAGHGVKLPAPRDGKALVAMISGFRGVIAGRMHASIIAYSLGIPSIGFVWNQKLRFWSERIGWPERFFELSEMTPELAMSRLKIALTQSCGPDSSVKQPVYEALEWFVKEYVRPWNTARETINYRKKLVACALGGIEMRYRSTNSPEAFQLSLQEGYRIFEADLRLTEEKELVLVSRWNRDSYKMLGLQAPDPGKDLQPPLPLKTFLSCRAYNRFATCTFDEFAGLFADAVRVGSGILNRHPLRLILSLGRPAEEDLPLMLQKLDSVIKKARLDPSDVLLRLERQKDIAVFRKVLPGSRLRIMYYYVPSKKDLEEGLTDSKIAEAADWCRKNSIGYICMNPDHYTETAAKAVRREDLKLCLFTLVKTERIIRCLNSGADMVASHYYGPDYLSRLTK